MSRPVLSAHAKVVLALKEGILSGSYQIGELLPSEDALVKQLEVSRVSLREGVKQLEALGWLRIERGSGTRVVQPGFRVIEPTLDFLARFEILRFHHVHELRSLIEIEVAAAVAARSDAALVARLRDANAAIERQMDAPQGYVDADVAFHDVLLEASPNPLYPLLMDGFRGYLLLSRRLSYAGQQAVRATLAAHELIVQAIEAGDPDAARERMAAHLDVTGTQLRLPDAGARARPRRSAPARR